MQSILYYIMSSKEHERKSTKAYVINKELIEFEKKYCSSVFIPRIPTDTKHVSEKDLPFHGQDIFNQSSLASKNTGDDDLSNKFPNEIHSSLCAHFSSHYICSDQSYGISEEGLAQYTNQEFIVPNPIKKKIQRRDASDDLSNYFR